MSDSLIAGVGSADAEQARRAVIELEAEGVKPTVRAIRERGKLANETALLVARAIRDGAVPPASAGPWTAAPWAVARDAERRAADARDLRAALVVLIGYLHDDALAGAVEALAALPCDLRRVAERYAFTDADVGAIGPEPVCTVGDWIAQLGKIDAPAAPPT